MHSQSRTWTGALITSVLVLGGGPALAWQVEINGTAPDSVDEGLSITVDASGDVIASGYTTNLGSSSDFTVLKLAGGDGTLLWQTDLDAPNSPPLGVDLASSVTLDPAGDVVAAGRFDKAATDDDFAVVKLAAADGAVLWRTELDGLGVPTSFDRARAVAVDASGDVVAAGVFENPGNDEEFSVVKLRASDGAVLWRRGLDGTRAPGMDDALSVALDADGNALVSGVFVNTVTGRDFAVVKLSDANGMELWRTEFDGTSGAFDRAFSVAVDAAGDVLAAGVLDNAATSLDFSVVKLAAADGAELWRTELDGSKTSPFQLDVGFSVAVDGAGNAIVSGSIDNASSSADFAVIKLAAADGAVLWRTELDGDDPNGGSSDESRAVVVDAAGDVFAAGRFQNLASGNDFSVVKLAGADGALLWRVEIDADGLRDTATALAVGPAGDVVATGQLEKSGSAFWDFTVVKLLGASGSHFGGDDDADGVTNSMDNCPFVPNGAGEALGQPTWGGQAESTQYPGVGCACLCGDPNRDCLVNVGDAPEAQRAGLFPPLAPLSPFFDIAFCDLNGDGLCNVGDSPEMQRAGLFPPLPPLDLNFSVTGCSGYTGQ